MIAITAPAELDALPIGFLGVDCDGDRWMRTPWGWVAEALKSFPGPDSYLPMTPAQPTSAQPTVEQVAEALFLHQYPESGGWNQPGWEIRRRPWLSMAAAVLALLIGRPESVVKAEALREAADAADAEKAGALLPGVTSTNWLRARADRIEAKP